MKWEQVRKFAEDNGLEIYTPLCGYHKQAQIIDRTAKRHYWTANKAGKAYQSLQAIVNQRELAKLTDEQAIAAGQEAKSFF
jgi:hypothetical protein